MDTLTHANTHSWLSGMYWNRSYAGHFLLWPSGSVITTRGERRPDGDKERRMKKWRKTGANKQNKLSKALCWAGAGTRACVCMWGDVNRVTGIRTDPGLSNSQLADDPILERSAAHQPPWDPRIRACICVWVWLCVCMCVCVYRHVVVRLTCVSVCTFASVQLYKQICVCVLVRKEGRAIGNQTEAVCASCPLFEGELWSFGPREEDRMKERSEQVAQTESKSCFSKVGHTKCLPASLLWISQRTLKEHTYSKHRYTNQPTTATKSQAWLCSEQERANGGMTTNELHVVLYNPRRPTDGQKETKVEKERERQRWEGDHRLRFTSLVWNGMRKKAIEKWGKKGKNKPSSDQISAGVCMWHVDVCACVCLLSTLLQKLPVLLCFAKCPHSSVCISKIYLHF